MKRRVASTDACLMQNLAYHACLKIIERRARRQPAWGSHRACLNDAAREIATLIDWDIVRPCLPSPKPTKRARATA